MGTIFFILAAIVVWSIAKSKSDESNDQRRLEDLRRRLSQQGSHAIDQPLESQAVERARPQPLALEEEADAAPERWSAWLDPEPGQAGSASGAEPPAAEFPPTPRPVAHDPHADPVVEVEREPAEETEPPGTTAPSEPPPLERLRQGLGFPEAAPPEATGAGSDERLPGDGEVAPSTSSDALDAVQTAAHPEPGSTAGFAEARAAAPARAPRTEPIPPLSEGTPAADVDPGLAERFEEALEQRSRAFAERGGPAPTELSISSSLVRPMGDLLSVLVHLEGGGAKHLAAQSRGLPVFGLRLAQPEELTVTRLAEAVDHLERAHPTLRRGCAERLMGALAQVRHARPRWVAALERLVGERD